MRIELGEDDGIFYDGIPRNIVVTVNMDDGRQIKFPYSAEKSMSALYEDLKRIEPSNIPFPTKENTIIPELKEPSFREPSKFIPDVKNSNIIEREDIVTCVKVEDRGQGATVDLSVGNEYRVLKVYKKGLTIPGKEGMTWVIDGYDVVDDNAVSPRRLFVYAHEVLLLRKRKPAPEKGKMSIEEIIPCPSCGEQTACHLDGSTFIGQCFKCGNPVVVERIIKNCKCGQANSLFLKGEIYQGQCMKCKAQLSEEYAAPANR